MNFKIIAANMFKGSGHSYTVAGTTKTFLGRMATDEKSIQIAPDADLKPGDCISDGYKTYMVLFVHQTETLPKAAIHPSPLSAEVVRSIDGPRDQFGRAAANMQTVATAVPLAFIGHLEALTAAKHGIQTGDVLRLPREEQLVIAVSSHEGLSRLKTQQLDGSDLAERIFRA